MSLTINKAKPASNVREINVRYISAQEVPPTLESISEPDATGSKVFFIGRSGCFRSGTKIMKYDRTKVLVENVVKGDVLLGDDQQPRVVNALCRGIERMYRLNIADGDIYVNKSHILTVIRNDSDEVADIPLKEFIDNPALLTEWSMFRTPIDGIYNEDVKLPIAKLVTYMALGHPTVISRDQIPLHLRDEYDESKVTTEELDFILEHSLTAYHISHRIHLLREIMTCFNGLVLNSNRRYIQSLAHSVGWIAMRVKDASGIVEVVNPIARLPFSIISLMDENYFGFQVDGNHRFILGNGVVTHNSGKCFGRDTGIKTHDGSVVNVQDIKVNDMLYGHDGKARRVLATTTGHGPMYRIVQPTGLSFECTRNHKLTYQSGDMLIDITAEKAKSEGVNLPMARAKIGDSVHLEKTLFQEFDHYNMKDNYHSKYFNDWSEVADAACMAADLGYRIELHPSSVTDFQHELRLIPYICSDPTEIKIQEVEDADYFGIQVDGDQRVVLVDGTITHNSRIMKSFAYEKQSIFAGALAFDGSNDFNPEIAQWIPPLFVLSGWDLEHHKRLRERQRIALKFLEWPWMFVVVNDVEDQRKNLNSAFFESVMKKSRHWKTVHGISSQRVMSIPPNVRLNIDGVFLCRETNQDNLTKLYNNFGSSVGTKQDFSELMSQLTTDYHAMYIDLKDTSGDLTNIVRFYKARDDIPDDWVLGCDEYIQHAKDRTNPSHAEDNIF